MRMYHTSRKQHSIASPRRGFTLIETLVAVTILLVAIVGPMTIAARGLQSAFFAREQVTAYALGQEALDLIRAIRDENAIAGRGWLSGIASSCARSNASGCGIDMRARSFRNCGTGSACQLRYDSGSLSGHAQRGMYNYATGDMSPFTRRIWVDQVAVGREAEVTVEVTWLSTVFRAERTVTLQTRIFNIYDNI